MSLDAPYDDENIFARIIRGDIPCAKIFEDEDVLAFMDAFPQAPGHALVIHKRAKATNLLDINDHALRSLIVAARRLACAMRAALAPDGIRLAQFNGEAAGQTVFHLHFHLIPVGADGALAQHASGGAAEMDALQETARKIAAALEA